MMKKLIIFLMAVLLPLSAFEVSADEKEARKIPLRVQEGVHRERSLIQIPIESYYLGILSSIQTTVTSDLGHIDMTVTNLMTGESWSDSFDSAMTPQTFLPISGAPGLYEITYLTSFGDLYEGTFTIE
mgnify:CR=1 FL=1